MADYNSIYTGPQIDSAVGLALTSIQPSAISNFETTSQLNDRDSDNRNRANHVGTQTASTISNFDSAVNALISGLGTLDSESVLGLIDSAYVQSKQDYSYSSLVGAPNVLDSSDVSLIASSLSGIDSSAAISLIDSAYVQARQDFAYGSLTGTPNVLDSSDVSLIASGFGGIDSSGVISLVDSAYVQLRQDFAYSSLTGTPNVLDSADVSLIVGDVGTLDSATVIDLIDSAYVQARQDFAYGSLTGTPNVLDSADVSLIAGSLSGIDSATVISLIDSAYVQARQDFAYGSLTGAPTALSAFTNDTLYLDSVTATQLIDSAYIQLRQLTAPPTGVDSAYVTSQINALIDGAPGALDTLNEIAIALNNDSNAFNTLLSKIDSNGTSLASKLDATQSLSLITTTVDSAYVQARQLTVGSGGIDSAASITLITSTVDSAYVQARQDFTYASLTGTPNVLDSADVALIAGASGVDSASVTAIVTSTVDSAYVQSRQDFAYGSLTGAPNVLDSADVALIAGSGGVDSAATVTLITSTVDSAYVQARQDFAYSSLTGTPNVLDSADVASISGGLTGLDSALTTQLIDSAYVQLRQDFAYGSLTGAPTALSAFTNDTLYLDSVTATQLIDSAYIQLRQSSSGFSTFADLTEINTADLDVHDIGRQAATTLVVTANGFSAYRFDQYGTVDNPTVYAKAGTTIGFDLTAVSGHPFQIQTSGGSTNLVGLVHVATDGTVTTQSSAQGKNSGTLYWKIPASVSDTYEYICQLHGGMNGAIAIEAAAGGGLDSSEIISLLDSAYVQARQDFAYASLTGTPTALSAFTNDTLYLDSVTATQLIDSAYIQLRQSSVGTGGVVDSAYVTSQINALIDGAPGALDTLNELAAAINDDSQAYNTLLSLVNTKIDSANALTLITTTIDSAYVQARQDFAYSSLIGSPNVLDSADVALIAGGSGGGLDSASAISLIDSAYVQLRQDYSYASLTGAPNTLDSASTQSLIDASIQVLDIADIVGATGNPGEYLKSLGDGSATWEDITTVIDSAYVQARSSVDSAVTISLITTTVDSAYVVARAGGAGVDSAATQSLIDASIQVLDIADIVGATGNPGEYLKSLGDGSASWEDITTVIDSAYVQARQLAVGSSGIDSATAITLITTTVDSAYVQSRQDFAYGSLTGAPIVLDSADVALITGSGGVDSASVASIVTSTVDSAYVQFRQDYSYASLTGAPNVLDSADVALIAGGGAGGGLDSSQTISLINTTVDSAYVQSRITSSAIYTRTITTSTAGQTVFAATYVPNYVDVFLNGVKILNTTDFVATNGTSITLNSASEAGDIVEITAWVPTAIVGSVNTWVSVDSPLTLFSGQKALVDTSSSAVTLTLPSSPNLGDEVRIIDATNNAETNNITVARNGSNIMGLAENFTVNINEAAFGLVYFNASRGWVLTEK